jgi:hypothetical protein
VHLAVVARRVVKKGTHHVQLCQDLIVRRPWGSTDRVSLSKSELARSTFAAETAGITLALCEWQASRRRI